MSLAVVTPLRRSWIAWSVVPACAAPSCITGLTWSMSACSHSQSVYCEPMPVIRPSLKWPCVLTKPGVTMSCSPPRTVAAGYRADSSAQVPTSATRSPRRRTAPSRTHAGVAAPSGAAVSTQRPRTRVTGSVAVAAAGGVGGVVSSVMAGTLRMPRYRHVTRGW